MHDMITRVRPEDWQRFRAIRLAALGESPEAFGSTLARERPFDEDEWRRRSARAATFVASRDGVDVRFSRAGRFRPRCGCDGPE